jgi:hypothetical protein
LPAVAITGTHEFGELNQQLADTAAPACQTDMAGFA